MRWEDERYVRLYTRDTPEWTLMSWEARSLFSLLLRAVDRAGILSLGRSGLKGVASLLRMPLEVVERAMPELLDDGCVAIVDAVLVIRNFIEAQEAVQSDAARQRVARERARDKTRAAELGILKEREEEHNPSHGVTDESRDVTEPSRAVTRGHAASRDVTLYRTVPSSFVSASAATPEPVGSAQPHPPPESVESGEGIQGSPGAGDETAPLARQEPHPAPSAPRKGPRKAKAKAEVEVPSSDATGDEVEAFLQTWRINGDEAEIQHFLDHHRSKGSRFRDWGAAWRTWQRNGLRFGRGGTVAPVRAPPKPITEQQLFDGFERLRNLKPGEVVW